MPWLLNEKKFQDFVAFCEESKSQMEIASTLGISHNSMQQIYKWRVKSGHKHKYETKEKMSSNQRNTW